MRSFWRVHQLAILFGALSVLAYFALAYMVERQHTYSLIAFFGLTAVAYWVLMEREKLNFNFLWVSGLLFRLVFIVAIPALSQDYFRFLWDGHLIHLGYSPYDFRPVELIGLVEDRMPAARELFEGMGGLSARHYSNYPPANQFIFAVGTWLGGGSILGSVIALRLIIIGSDVAVVFLLRELLRKFNISTHHAFWYYLNPLVILELTGNLHFEGVMIALFCLALWLLVRGRFLAAGLIYGLSIGLKLVPLLFLPLLPTYLNFRRSAVFFAGIGLSVIGMCAPFYSEQFLLHYQDTIGLWFSGFRFNAGIYGGVNWIAREFFDARPWILIKEWGTWLPVATALCAAGLVLYRYRRDFVQLTQAMMFLLGFYFLLTPTVHPWYLAFLVFLGVFGRIRFQIVWSIAVVLSYAAYREPEFQERHLLIIAEYVLVFATLIYDFVTYRKYDGKFRKNLA